MELFENAALLFIIMDGVLFDEGIPLLGINFCASELWWYKKVYVLTNT
jgi:hypothetical protein